jgi:hypothetical protein
MCTSLAHVASWATRVDVVGAGGRRRLHRRSCTAARSQIAKSHLQASGDGGGGGGGGGGDDDVDVIASPKNGKRSKAGARRMKDDARAVADALSDASFATHPAPSECVSSPRHRRNLARLASYARWGDGVQGFFEPGLLQLYLALDALHEERSITVGLFKLNPVASTLAPIK